MTKDGVVPQLETAAKTDNGDNRKLVMAGDFVINSRSDRKGSAGVSPLEGSVSVISTVLEPRALKGSYVHHLLRSQAFQEEYYRYGSGIVADLWSTRYSAMKMISLPAPSAAEQKDIAGFLDKETAKIDALIGKQEQLIATLYEDRTATITNAVTKGLDPEVEMVEASSPWNPPSPPHWKQSVQLKRVASVQSGLTLGRPVEPEAAVVLPYMRVANVQAGTADLTEVKEVAVDRAEVPKYLLRDGDVLMTEGGDIDKLGRGCLWQGEIQPCLHQNHVFAVRCSEGLVSRFLVYLLDTSVARNYFMLTARKTTNLASTNSTTLGRFVFSLPDVPEQYEIVDFLDARCRKIDALIAKAHEVIETLREYRSALITDAVTGKIDVRGVA
ncbi:type I restriction endonuclease subunit S [Rhodococcus opacus]|nr:type I restriction endonuclease subunit S [Rhodococcus opacus]